LSEIATIVNKSKTTISTMIKSLCKHGFIELPGRSRTAWKLMTLIEDFLRESSSIIVMSLL